MEPSTPSIRVVHAGRILASVGKVFPLCCPVEEYRWIDGWKCELLHCPHGRVELGCVFREMMSAPFLLGAATGLTTWTAVLHDPEAYRLHFRLDNVRSSSLYKIEMQGDGGSATDFTLDLDYHPIGAWSARESEARSAARLRTMLSTLSAMLGHYGETGRMLKIGGLAGLLLRSDQLTASDRLRIALNKVHMVVARDTRGGGEQ